MNIQVKLAIIAIVTVIPLVSMAVYGTSSNISISTSSIDSPKLQVISSFSPLYEFSQIVGGEKADVTLLVPVGVEPHDWEPTIKDVQKMHSSDLIVINGIGFENWIDNLVENDYQGEIVDTSNGILISTLDDDEDDDEDDEKHVHASKDPHIWLNPVYAKKQVQNIALAFSNSDPENREFYSTNAAQYVEELSSLDLKIRDDLSNCTDDFIAFHDAFSYFANEYSLHQHSVVASNDSHGEVTAKTLENVILKARELDIKVIFSEQAINTKTSQTIANEINGKVLVLSPLEIVSEGTYISKMTLNLENLKEALC